MQFFKRWGLSALLMTIPLSASAFQWFDPLGEEGPPEKLSQLGMYSNIETKEISPELIPFDVNSPLWSDGTKKERFIVLGEGQSVKFIPNGDYYEYPEQVAFLKNFFLETVPGDPESQIIIETRLLIRKVFEEGDDEWFGYSYRWNESETEANLVHKFGEEAQFTIWPEGKENSSEPKRWLYPAQFDCTECHRIDNFEDNSFGQVHGRSVLGFFTAQLNMAMEGNPEKNQLEFLFEQGVFEGESISNIDNLPKWAGIDDTSASIEKRALSYLASNCSGCHGKRGEEVGAVFGPLINFDYHEMKPNAEQHILEDGSWSYDVDNSMLLSPGHPEKSIIFLRQMWRPNLYDNGQVNFDFISDEQMPPLATYEHYPEALNVVGQWIIDLCDEPDSTAVIEHCDENPPIDTIPTPPPDSTKSLSIYNDKMANGQNSFVIQNGFLVYTGDIGVHERVVMVNHKGQRIRLEAQGQGRFKPKANLPPGIYFLKVGKNTFQLPLF